MSVSFLSAAEVVAGISMLVVSSLILTLTIEEIGKRGKFSAKFTGAVVSPMFTAMPELVIILFALFLVGNRSGSEIAAGTIIGEPFMVSSLGFPIVALALLTARKKEKIESIDRVLSKTLIFMGLIFPVMLIPFFFDTLYVRVVVAVLLLLFYVIFFKFISGKESFEEEVTVFKINNLALLLFVIVVGLALLFGGSITLVRGIENLSLESGVNRELITILLVPIGTIVPETMNAIIWALRGKTTLAIGAMAGEEMYFATFFPALGILVSQWVITFSGIAAVLLTSSFSISIGLVTYKFRNASFIFIFYIASFLVFLILIY